MMTVIVTTVVNLRNLSIVFSLIVVCRISAPMCSYGGCTVGALRRLDRNGRQAQWTIFGSRSCWRVRFLQPVHLLHQQEDHECDDDEIEHGLEKDTVIDRGRPGGLRRGQRGLGRRREIEKQTGEVHLA